MRVALQYKPGTVPAERAAENVERLWAWLDQLRDRPEHVMTIALGDHRRIGRATVDSTPPGDFGFTVVDVDDIEGAVALTQGWPEFEWGGAVDVRPEVTP
ncbi:MULTISPECIES: YciI family protein [Microbacterium]|uniref:YciI family protein n=1 Tax=Microbacterium TaxID=33882 RepID=UPI000D654216|nr:MULTISPECIES: YciI family protein [Microbacterium]